MPKYQYLSEEMVQQIVNETRAKRALSQPEIKRLDLELNVTLSEYVHSKEFYSEPTSSQLSGQINKLHNALRGLKEALPSLQQVSLRYYLIHLGEVYAAIRGPHPGLTPHSLGAWNPETEEEVSAIDHYRSDERLNEMISSISQVLEWMNNTPVHMREVSNWWERKPHWLEDDTEQMWERLLHAPRELPKDVHRRRLTEDLIGMQLPKIYEKAFSTNFGISRHPPGPGVRFILAVLRHAGIVNEYNNQPFAVETVITYAQSYPRGRRILAASLLDNEQKNKSVSPTSLH